MTQNTETPRQDPSEVGLPDFALPAELQEAIHKLEAIKEPWNKKARDEGVRHLKELVEKTDYYETQVEIWEKVKAGYNIAKAEEYVRSRIASAEREYRSAVKEIQDNVEAKRVEAAEYEKTADEARLIAEEAHLKTAQAQQDLEDIGHRIDAARRELTLTYTQVKHFHNPAERSVSLREELEQVRGAIASFGGVGTAVKVSDKAHTVNGQAVSREYIEHMAAFILSAYNQEVENTILGIHHAPNAQAALQRLVLAKDKAESLGALFSITLNPQYHELRGHEVDLSFRYKTRLDIEREEEKRHQEELRAQKKAGKNAEITYGRIDQEESVARRQYDVRVAELMIGQPEDTPIPDDDTTLQRLQLRLDELANRRKEVADKLENFNAGYIYVLTNTGSFGEDVVKIGMTRLEDPTLAISAINQSAVPFEFDTHAIYFSEMAAELEKKMASAFAGHEINKAIPGKGFYRVLLTDVEKALLEFTGGKLTEFVPVAPTDTLNRTVEIEGTLD